ncbi:glycerol uptake facilitator GlpF [Salmonella enterica subsp. enterica serovar Typhimurium]|nr:glycerol uptake facilitator GlpF [Salmonella enterica subsp. enterica serovar Typhimurium]
MGDLHYLGAWNFTGRFTLLPESPADILTLRGDDCAVAVCLLPQTESIALYYWPSLPALLAALCWRMCFIVAFLLNLRLRIIWCAVASKVCKLASIFSTYPAAALNVWQAALVEVVITSILMGMIMALTDDGNGIPKGPLAPLLIGILVAVIGASTGPPYRFCNEPGA